MNKNLGLQRIYYPAAIAVTLLAVALRIAACLVDLNFSTGYFEGKTLIYFANTVCILGVIFALTYLFKADKAVDYLASFKTPATYVSSGIVFCAALFFILNLSLTGASALPAQSPIAGSIRTAISILGIPALIYLILNGFVTSVFSTARATTGICWIALLSLYAAYLYFDTEMPLNAPNKIIDQMALLFCALFFLYEIRISLSRGKWRAYVAFGMIGAMLSLYSSVPSIAVFFIRGQAISLSIYENVLTLALAIFISARLYLMLDYGEDKESEFITLMRSSIEDREQLRTEKRLAQKAKEKIPHDPEESETVPGQISLFDIPVDKTEDRVQGSDEQITDEGIYNNEENTGN
jgi:hypothetical protein